MAPRKRSSSISSKDSTPPKSKSPGRRSSRITPDKGTEDDSKEGEDSDNDSSIDSKDSDEPTDPTQPLFANQKALVNRGSSGIGPKSLPLMTYELRSADNYEDWRKALEAYSLSNNSWTLIFEPHADSLHNMMRKYSSYRTMEDITQAHDEWCGKLFGVMYQSVMKLTGDVLLGELRALQPRRSVDVLADPHHLLQCISDRYEQLSCFSLANDFIKVFSMHWNINQNPAELREKLLAKIIRFQNGDTNKISEGVKMMIIYNTIPSDIQPLIRGYIPNKALATFDDVYNALKIMYDEKKSKGQSTKHNHGETERQNHGDLTKKEKRVLSLLRGREETSTPRPNDKRKLHCWYCDGRDHTKFTCPKVNEDKKKGIDVKANPFKPAHLLGKQDKRVMAVMKQQQDDSEEEDYEPGKRVRFNMCILSLDKLQTSDPTPGFIGQIIDNRILNSRRLHLDSGAFMHITSDRTILINIRKLDVPIPLTGAFGQQIIYVREVGDIVLSIGVKFREVGIVPNAHMTLISEARIQQAGYGINKPPGKAIAKIYIEEVVNDKLIKKTIMEFEKDKSTDLWTYSMEDGQESPQERYLEKSGMVRFRSKPSIAGEEDKKEEANRTSKRIQKKGVLKKGGSIASIQQSLALPQNKRKRE